MTEFQDHNEMEILPKSKILSEIDQRYLNNRLIEKSKFGNQEDIVDLISAGAKVNAVGKELGETSLMNAANWGSKKIVDLLIALGANVNDVDCFGSTVLMQATNRGRIKVVKRLIDAGANVNATIHRLIHHSMMNKSMMAVIII